MTTVIGELALGKSLDVLGTIVVGQAKRLWKSGPIGRVLVLLREDFGKKAGFDREDFFAWEQDEEIRSVLADLVEGRLKSGPDTTAKIAAAFEPKLYRVPDAERPLLAKEMAEAAQQAAPLVLEGGRATLFIENRIDEGFAEMQEQIAALHRDLKQLKPADAQRSETADAPGPIPVPSPAGEELPGIAEALLRGPLQRAGKVDAARRANDLLKSGDVDAAVEAMHEVARGLRGAGSPTLAERYQEWAAVSLIDSGVSDRAVDFLVELGLAQARRGSEATRFTAGRIKEVLGDERRWLPDGIEALVNWPERPDHAVETLRTAVAECPAEARLGWKAALVELLVVLGRYPEALDVVRDDLSTDLASGDRTAIELDAIDATEETQGQEQAEEMWAHLLGFAAETDDQEQRAIILQRRIRTLLMRGELEAAIAIGGDAAAAWSSIDGADQQAAQGLFDIQTAALLLGRPPPGMELRAMASGARGTGETPASIGEQLLMRGIGARLSGKFPDALAAFGLSLMTHRRVGNFQGEHEVYEQLGGLYSEASSPAQALSMFIAAGKAKEAIEAAAQVSGPGIAEVVGIAAPSWQRDAMYRVLGRHGRRLPRAKAIEIVEKVTEESTDAPSGPFAPQPSISARAALAQIVFALPEEKLGPVVDRLRGEIENPADIETLRTACESLILATNIGLVDESELLIDAYLADASLHNISSLWVAERLTVRADQRNKVRAAALDGSRDALEALAVADLLKGDREVRSIADGVISKAAERENIEEKNEGGQIQRSIGVGVDYQGVAIIAGAVGDRQKSAFTDRLISTLSDDREPIVNRASAANAVFNLADALPTDRVEKVVGILKGLAAGGYGISEVDEEAAASQDPFSRFRIGLGAPEELRASATEAWARLVGRHDLDTDDLEREIQAGFRSLNPELLRGVLRALSSVPSIPAPMALERFVGEEEVSVRMAAVDAIAARQTLDNLDSLPNLLKDPAVPVRLALLSRARIDGPAPSATVLRELEKDEDGYVRGMAAMALDEFDGTVPDQRSSA